MFIIRFLRNTNLAYIWLSETMYGIFSFWLGGYGIRVSSSVTLDLGSWIPFISSVTQESWLRISYTCLLSLDRPASVESVFRSTSHKGRPGNVSFNAERGIKAVLLLQRASKKFYDGFLPWYPAAPKLWLARTWNIFRFLSRRRLPATKPPSSKKPGLTSPSTPWHDVSANSRDKATQGSCTKI